MVIGVIGEGLFGSWFVRFFQMWFPETTVMVSDLDTPLTNISLAEQANVILVAVPVGVLPAVLSEIAPYTRPDQLIIEIASTNKEAIHDALLKTRAEFWQIHPMCRPPEALTFSGFTVVIAEEDRLELWRAWTKTFLAATKGKVVQLPLAKMDRYAALVQVAVHVPLLAYCKTLMAFHAETDEPSRFVDELFQVASGFYQITMATMLRIIRQEPSLYWNVIHENPHSDAVLDVFERELRTLRAILATNNFPAFEQIFLGGREFADEENLKKGFKLFDVLKRDAETLWNEK
ncbi:MAG: prephenate dehydrogenase/arogenate dehydrogenase family protein [bacterium]|nr:prephenate dehydrogenase/arogenate dehydrogenase family protein [bacterium]